MSRLVPVSVVYNTGFRYWTYNFDRYVIYDDTNMSDKILRTTYYWPLRNWSQLATHDRNEMN